MHLGVCAQAFYHLPFESAVVKAAELGYESMEIPVDARSPFVNLDAAIGDGARELDRVVSSAGLRISALSNHQEGTLLLGPHGFDTDAVLEGSRDEKVDYATERLVKTARLAALADVRVVCGFIGCEDYSRWFPWPLADGYERMVPTLRNRFLPILDEFATLGVVFALECHPRQFSYNLETSLLLYEALDRHDALRFNFDPANLVLAGMDPTSFVAELGHLIVHVHAKDAEVVRHNAGRSGLLAHGSWTRPDRGFRFRVPGWGQLDWKEIITVLRLSGFDGCLAVEHEDPTMSQLEGLEQAARFLRPLVLHEAVPTEPWW